MNRLFRTWVWLGGLVLISLIAGCAAPTKPTITLTPISGQIVAGQDITVQSSASDNRGIIRIEFLVDGIVAADAKIDPPQKTIALPHTWKASAGQHTLSVRAINQDNLTSDPATIVVLVGGAPTVVPTQPPAPTVAVPTVPRPPTVPPTAAPTVTPTCTNAMRFISDVTVPDGTPWLVNQPFNKIWRVQNSGTCTWSSKYHLVWVGGDAMGVVREIPVPVNVSSVNMVDFTIPLTAPNRLGPAEGRWQLRDDTGKLFGPVLTVKINVVSAQPTPAPTAAGCTGTPSIQSFTADQLTITSGQSTTLRWGLVGNASRVEIDNGIGGIATPGTFVVAPHQNTTYTLIAWCGSNQARQSVTIAVQSAPPAPTPAPQRLNISGTWIAGEYALQLQEALGCGGPSCGVTGKLTQAHGVTTPTIENVQGSFNVYTGAFSLTIERPGAGAITGTVYTSGQALTANVPGAGSLIFTKQ